MGLIELLVAVFISLLLLLGLFGLLYGVRQNYLAQDQLSQLQERERLTMGIVTDVVQQAGYYPNPTQLSVTDALGVQANVATAAGSVSFAAGQIVAGTPTAIFVRYLAGSNDSVTDCSGQSNPIAGTGIVINAFYLDPGGGGLACAIINGDGASTAAPVLIPGVQSVSISFGVDTNSDGSVDEYLTAANMSSTNWMAVLSVQVSLTFAAPLTGSAAPGAGVPVNPSLTRTIALLNRI